MGHLSIYFSFLSFISITFHSFQRTGPARLLLKVLLSILFVWMVLSLELLFTCYFQTVHRSPLLLTCFPLKYTVFFRRVFRFTAKLRAEISHVPSVHTHAQPPPWSASPHWMRHLSQWMNPHGHVLITQSPQWTCGSLSVDLFTVSTLLPFPECPTLGIIQPVSTFITFSNKI